MSPRPRLVATDNKFTPHRYLNAVRKVLGEIELDPASCAAANERVKALKYYDYSQDALIQEWKGKTFLNPPYSKGNLEPFTRKLMKHHSSAGISEAILLVPNWTERKWFQPLWKYPRCFTDHRISYVDGFNLKLCGNPEGGSCFFYFPYMLDYEFSIEKFFIEFRKFGHVEK